MKPFTAYMALSAKGHPAPFIGFAFQRGMLKASYERTFGGNLEVAGYRIVKVIVTEASKGKKR